MSKIGVALSGGVDSSLVALMLREQGHEVIAVTLKVQDEAEGESVCAGNAAVERARGVAEYLGIPHYVCDVSRDFREIILRHAQEEYAHARTPSPCVRCNEWIKFGKLVPYVQSLGCTHLATGHYAKIVTYQGRSCIARGVDSNKDQSYFLSGVPPMLLDHVMFPLGGLCKPEVRVLAEKYGLPSAKTADSQNVCITRPGQTFAETLWEIFGAETKRGHFIVDGRLSGFHDGLHRYTVGQRHGLGNLAPAKPVWVKKVGPVDVEVTTVGRELDVLYAEADQLNWHVEHVPTRCLVQIRYRHKPVMATVKQGDGVVQVSFDTPVHAVTPGQAMVFYDNDVVIGRGWIR